MKIKSSELFVEHSYLIIGFVLVFNLSRFSWNSAIWRHFNCNSSQKSIAVEKVHISHIYHNGKFACYRNSSVRRIRSDSFRPILSSFYLKSEFVSIHDVSQSEIEMRCSSLNSQNFRVTPRLVSTTNRHASTIRSHSPS